MPTATQTPGLHLTEAPGYRALFIDMRSPEACAVMAASYAARRRELALANPTAKVRGAIYDLRKTQANDRAGVRGYYANASQARAEVYARIAALRAARDAFDTKEAADDVKMVAIRAGRQVLASIAKAA